MQSHRFSMSRYFAALSLGAVATACLLLLMHSLIEPDSDAPQAATPVVLTPWYRLLEDLPPPPTNDPVPPPDVQPPPVTDLDPLIEVVGGDWSVGIIAPSFDPPTGLAGGVSPDSDALPIVKVTPTYPRSAASRGIEGYVIVRFVIDELGRVVDPVVVDAQPRGLFERSALEAVKKFKYKPRVLDGQAIPVRDVLHRLTYELADA